MIRRRGSQKGNKLTPAGVVAGEDDTGNTKDLGLCGSPLRYHLFQIENLNLQTILI